MIGLVPLALVGLTLPVRLSIFAARHLPSLACSRWMTACRSALSLRARLEL